MIPINEQERNRSEEDRDEFEQNRFDFENRRVNDRPVNYCPHCGRQLESAPDVHPEEPSPEPTPTILPREPINRPEDIDSSGVKPVKPAIEPLIAEPKAISRKGTWILLAIMAVGFLGYLVFLIKDDGKFHPPPLQTSSIPTTTEPLPKPTTSDRAKRETARVLALEALRQGTILSVTISKLPKLEKVLQAAKKLQDISPRYQPQVTTAESSLRDAHDKRDKSLIAYLNKVLELGRYSPEQLSYALETIRNGDLTPRERIVVELLANQLVSLRNNVKPDPANWLSDFTERFSDFLD